jgi:thiol-disulfide isomerase/thioredoxin
MPRLFFPLTFLALLPLTALAQLPAPPIATATTQPRDEQSIVTDLHAANEQLALLLPALPSIADPDFRAANSQKLIPLLHHFSDLFLELKASQSDPATRDEIDTDRSLYLALLVTLHDAPATAALTTEAAAPSPAALDARCALTLGTWWANSKNPAVQSQLLDALTADAKANPASDRLAITLSSMSNVGPANDDLAKRALDALRPLTSDAAKQILADADALAVLHAMVGKPLVINARTSTNTHFSTDTLKGKVVLIDCWATWCGPCLAGLPALKELYAANHAKGLEIVGIDCDDSDDTVNTFTKAQNMPWIQFRELSQTDDPWHPLTHQWHVDSIPTMFLLDKKGILRYIDAREDTATKVAQLLAENP